MIRAIATGIAALAAVGVFAQSNIPTVSHEYADVNGVRLHYARAGTGPLMIFLHGFPEFWYEWKNQLAEFSRDHTAVAPDMRGYNLSSKPAELSAYQIPQLVEDVRALATMLNRDVRRSTFDVRRSETAPNVEPRTPNDEHPDRFTLVAHDWGGVVAWVFAAQHPEMLDKLVIINAPHPTVFARELRDNPAQQQASQYMLMFRSPEAEATLSADGYARLVTAILGGGSGTVSNEDKAAYIAAWSQPGALTGGLNYYRASAIGPPRPGPAPPAPSEAVSGRPPALSEAGGRVEGMIVKVPTLVIWGEKDTALLTGNLNGLDQLVPTLTVKRVPDATHWIVREKPAEVNRLIRDFIAGR